MRRFIAPVWICLLFVMVGVGTTLGQAKADSSVTLQDLIDDASSGATIILPPGRYEGPLVVDKSIELIVEEEGTVTLHHSGSEPAIRIEADEVTLTGLYIETASDGIVMRDADRSEVRNTTIVWGGSSDTKSFAKGNGIDLYNAHQVRLIGNTIRSMSDGIYMENSDDTHVADNRIENSRYGVHCMYTKGTVIERNVGIQNVTGAMVMAVRNVKVIQNTFTEQDENVNAQGILLFDAEETLVEGNSIEGNRVGLYVEKSANNELVRNKLTYNFIGIQLIHSEQNVIRENQMMGNVSDAEAKDSPNNEITSNFWDGLQGIDLDGDGASELRYAINPFFSGLVQKRPAFQLFFQSPGMVFLESLFQADRSLWTTDRQPLLSPPLVPDQTDVPTQEVWMGVIGLLLLGCSSLLILWSRRKSV